MCTLRVGKRHLQTLLLIIERGHPMNPDLRDNLGDFGDKTKEDYKYAAVWIDWERLWSANAFEEPLWSFVCSASWKAGELSAIESAVTAIISELLSVCVARSGSAVTTSDLLSVCAANLYKCYCSCYLCFVFF
ncbi:hypothetical protein AVEN_56239-1 [Araneus ventricosus]|uniref:Uncharacterized protein n=1 Tax=Araneus ventricosus TaxID=182803 RepID=A0A4Y2SI02_ARAVE|nr:hypothetical protein AVEN_56239-1 [Araneus ventricosus]